MLDVRGNFAQTLTGAVSVGAGTVDVTGAGTQFTQELAVDQAIQIGFEVFIVAAIADDLNLTLDAPHTAGASSETAHADPNSLLTVASGAGISYLHVDGAGNVGVGTTAPESRLDVRNGSPNGAIKEQQQIITKQREAVDGQSRRIHSFESRLEAQQQLQQILAQMP